MSEGEPLFQGFDAPQQNWSRLPHALIAALPAIETMAELKVILYILRHTWGFREFDKAKRITLDEFAKGRKRQDGGRIDGGVGMNKQAIVDGLKRAVDHGFIEVEEDARDKGRIKKAYMLRYSEESNQEYENHTSGIRKSPPSGRTVIPRTEKETLEEKPLRETFVADAPAPPLPDAEQAGEVLDSYGAWVDAFGETANNPFVSARAVTDSPPIPPVPPVAPPPNQEEGSQARPAARRANRQSLS